MTAHQPLISITSGLPRWMRRASTIVDVVCILAAIYVGLAGAVMGAAFLFMDRSSAVSSNMPLTLSGRVVATFMVALMTACLLWGLINASICFKGLAKGEPFARRTVRAFRNFTLGLLAFKAGAAINVLTLYLVGAATVHWTGKVDLNLKAGLDDEVLTLILLAALTLIAVVLARAVDLADEAAALAAENQQFV